MTGLELELPVALFLLLNLVVALARAARGPPPARSTRWTATAMRPRVPCGWGMR
jgi:hypothetical protein